MKQETTETVIFGAGCFWCTEAVFTHLRGVTSVIPGYTGGTIPNPTYEMICTGTTGYIEVAKITYNPAQISFDTLLTVFFSSHDPTSIDKQGADAGTQYRSVIYTMTDKQFVTAQKVKKQLDTDGTFSKPIVTEIHPLTQFYQAEAYHQNYFASHTSAPYCQFVISPKLTHIRNMFPQLYK